MFRMAIFVVLTCSLCASGQDKASLHLNHADLTVLGITIGTSTQADVNNKLGTAPAFKISQSEGADQVTCYRSKSDGDETVVAFYFGALGGWRDVTRISISNSGVLRFATSRCKSISAVSHDLQFLRGLKLGASPSDVRHVLGSPSRSSKKVLTYYVSHECPPELLPKKAGGAPAADGACEVVDSVEAKFDLQLGLEYASFYRFVDK